MHFFAISVIASFGGVAAAKPICAEPFPMPLCKGIKIEDAPIGTLQQLMTESKLTSKDLVTCYLARIDETNQYLHSISEVNPDALSIAASMDEERAKGQVRGPMHGIPFVVKDNMYTNDKHNTSEGTLVLLGGKYSSEATVVAKIRAAGGVLLGHSTMSEAADHRALTKYASGYSSRTGQTRNPYNLTQPTAGSSSGSVVAVKTNQVAIAFGTETHGTFGSVHDRCAILLDIMKGPDRYDNLTFEAIGHYPEKGYSAEIVKKDALRGMKLGLPWNPYWSTNGHLNSPGNRKVYEEHIRQLKVAGAEIYNITYQNAFASIANPYGSGHPSNISSKLNHVIAYSTLMAVGYAEWLQNWTFPENDERHGMSTISEMADWNDAHNETTGSLGNGIWWWDPTSGQSFYDLAVQTNGTMGSEFWTAFGWGRTIARRAIDSSHAYVQEDGEVVELDGLLVPNGRDGGSGNACASIPSYTGYPIAAVPTGQDSFATPYGLCIYGKQYGEAKLVRVASAMEDLFQWNEKPKWYNYDTAKGPWDAPAPGYTCSTESLNRYACES